MTHARTLCCVHMHVLYARRHDTPEAARVLYYPHACIVCILYCIFVCKLYCMHTVCRHDTPEAARVVLRETRHCEGTFAELRAAGAPGEGPAYVDADATAQAFQVRGPREHTVPHGVPARVYSGVYRRTVPHTCAYR